MTDRIEHRLADLEQRCKGLRLWCVGLSAALVASCLAAVTSPKIVRAQRFVIEESDGTQRGYLGLDNDGQALLALTGGGTFLGLRTGGLGASEDGDGEDPRVGSLFLVADEADPASPSVEIGLEAARAYLRLDAQGETTFEVP